MADTVLNTTVFDGDKKLITHYNVISDGTGNTTTLVDVSTLNTNKLGEACTKVILNKVSCNVSATPAIRLLWDATTDVAFQTLQGEMTYDYSSFGGLKNTEATGYTGDVKLNLPSTAVTGDTGTVVCEWIKQYD